MKNTALQEIMHAKHERLAQRKAATPLDAMRALAGMQKRPEPMLSTVTDDGHVMLIGQIRYGDSYDPVAQALRYAQSGLDGIALFTDNQIYDGAVKDLALITRTLPLPVLLQNYLFDEYQVVEARAGGASSVTLIAEMLDPAALRVLVSVTQRNRMSAIVRVKNEAELEAAAAVCPSVMELGGRDPVTNALDICHIRALREKVPSMFRVLFYNRIVSYDEAKAVAPLKPDGVMVGARLLAQDGAVARLREIFGK
jgi:indole-3-glycerol phosphate synthase